MRRKRQVETDVRTPTRKDDEEVSKLQVQVTEEAERRVYLEKESNETPYESVSTAAATSQEEAAGASPQHTIAAAAAAQK